MVGFPLDTSMKPLDGRQLVLGEESLDAPGLSPGMSGWRGL